jgi:ParB/RepB/Spo0J family partition protein
MKIKNEVIEIPIGELKVKKRFNIRDDFGDCEDLENSMEKTGNISPIGVEFVNGSGFELLYGERRYNAAKKIGITALKCLVYECKDEYERFMIMFNENLGRKDLTWKEECKALKLWKNFELKNGKTFDKIIEDEAKRKGSSERTIWRVFETIKAIEEFPQLEKEMSRSSVLSKYQELKKLDTSEQDKIKAGTITAEKAFVKKEKTEKVKTIAANDSIIDEMKEEINHYKKQANELEEELKSGNIFATLNKMSKEDRIEKGVWLTDEVRKFIAAARSCSGFGFMKSGETDEYTCPECKKNDLDTYEMCKWWHDTFEKAAKK